MVQSRIALSRNDHGCVARFSLYRIHNPSSCTVPQSNSIRTVFIEFPFRTSLFLRPSYNPGVPVCAALIAPRIRRISRDSDDMSRLNLPSVTRNVMFVLPTCKNKQLRVSLIKSLKYMSVSHLFPQIYRQNVICFTD